MAVPSDARARNFVGWTLRAIVSAAVLIAIFSILPARDVFATIRNVDSSLWLASFSIFLIGHVVSAAKWQLLAVPAVSFPLVLRAHFAGLAANLCLPGVAGGDVVRAALMFKAAADKARLALGSLVDRLVDLAALLLIAIGSLAFAIHHALVGVHLLVGIVVAIIVAALTAALVVKLFPIVLDRLPHDGRPRRILEQAATGFGALARRPRRLALCLGLSTAVQATFIAVNIAIAEAVGVHVPVAAWFVAWPLSKIVATLPISIAGLGVREASLASLLAPFGAASTAVIAVGLIWQSILFAAGLVGGAVLALSSRPREPRDGRQSSVKLQ